MPKITLDIGSIEKDFFAGMQLLAMAAPATPGYRFCWILNYYLDMRFQRCPESDVCMSVVKKNKSLMDDLFSGMEAAPDLHTRYFPVYRHSVEGSELSVLLYSNFCEGSRLIREVPAADFFLLYPDNPLVSESAKIKACEELRCVTWAKNIDIDNLVSRSALIL